MTYHAIGLMSGSSLDGLDIAFAKLTEEGGAWRYEWIATECFPYPPEWIKRLKEASSCTVPEFLALHTAYGHFTGKLVSDFLKKNGAAAKADFIASHGHTVFHQPHNATTFQIGDGASIAAETGLPVIADLRNMDIALGGQGAPIVPVGDRLLFPEYECLLNLGGIANVSIRQPGGYIAFDICPCNQLLDYYAQQAGLPYDSDGMMAGRGTVNTELLTQLASAAFYGRPAPKSLANEFSSQEILPVVDAAQLSINDALATCAEHIAVQIAGACNGQAESGGSRMLVTGGGAFNGHLIQRIQQLTDTEVIVPEAALVQYKEALVMALIGAMRWRQEVNVYASATGAARDSVAGAVWWGR